MDAKAKSNGIIGCVQFLHQIKVIAHLLKWVVYFIPSAFMKILDIVNRFDISSPAINCVSYGNGHINSTFLVYTKGGKEYVLQKINSIVFKDVDLLMNNVYEVTRYLRKNGFESLHPVKTEDGKLYIEEENSFYRLYDYIEGTVCYEKVTNVMMIYNDAKAFGKLHKTLAKFDVSKIGEVIPDFHNTLKRYENLKDAIKEDKCGRVDTCLEEIETVEKYKDQYGKIIEGIKSGEISNAVTHNDPKINNVLFDKFSGEIRAVIDLDTVMPGSYLYDYGDALRSLFTGDNEDSEELNLLIADRTIFEGYTKGYLSEMKDILTPKEIEYLPFSVFLLSIECGMRFLEDYIRGDVYFKTKYYNHNLIRARTQLALAEDIYRNMDELTQIVNRLIKAEKKKKY